MKNSALAEISVRTELRPGDIGYLIYLHGELYRREYDYGIEFETYVAEGLVEFARQYNPANQRVWICEHQNKMIGFMLLMNRGPAAQLRYFIIRPEYRGIGLGSKLMNLYMEFLAQCPYQSTYLWTTADQLQAGQLYQKFGFELVEERVSDAFGKTVREQRFELVVGNRLTGNR